MEDEEESSIPLIRVVISEMVEEIFHIHHIYCAGEPRSESPDPVDAKSPDPVEAKSPATDASVAVIECPCCDIAWDKNKERCKCTDNSSYHEVDPPVEAMSAGIIGETACCECGDHEDLSVCYACQCLFCIECIHSHPDLNTLATFPESGQSESSKENEPDQPESSKENDSGQQESSRENQNKPASFSWVNEDPSSKGMDNQSDSSEESDKEVFSKNKHRKIVENIYAKAMNRK